MSNPAAIITALKDQLTDDATLSEYVKSIFLGVREGIAQFPAIVIEPVGMDEDDDIRDHQELYFTVAVMAYVNVKDADKQIVGDSDVKGILDVENEVKKAISSDKTLGGLVANLEIKETRYDVVDYPVRAFSINVIIYFRQNLTSRT